MSHQARAIRVAAIQSISQLGEAEANLDRAEALIAKAVAAGSELVVCPEYLTPGYVWDRAMWRHAEYRGGRTERWLSGLSARYGIFLGAGYLEVEGEDFWNTFALTGPDGAIVGRVRKQSRPWYEGWVSRSSDAPKTFDSPLGRIGIGICADNYMRRFFEQLLKERPELLLMPHSAPFAVPDNGQIRQGVSEIGTFYARSFGIPTIVANKAATPNTFRSVVPSGESLELQFPGMSTITDSDGEPRAQLKDIEGIVCAEVLLAPDRMRIPLPPRHSYWSYTARTNADLVATLYMELERQATQAYAEARDERLAVIAELRREAECEE